MQDKLRPEVALLQECLPVGHVCLCLPRLTNPALHTRHPCVPQVLDGGARSQSQLLLPIQEKSHRRAPPQQGQSPPHFPGAQGELSECARAAKAGNLCLLQKEQASSWIEHEAATNGDYLPHKQEVVLPAGFKTDLYAKFRRESTEGT